MKTTRLLRLATSVRTTVALLTVLAVLLFLNVALPQAAVLGERAFLEIAESSAVHRFFLVTLSLGRMSTNPIFLSALVAFFVQLALVLGSRVGPTLRKMQPRTRSADGLEAWTRTADALATARPSSWDAATAVATLRGFGYRIRRVGPRCLSGVKHRTAALGFLLFHLSFFLLCAGGVLIYMTRFVGLVRLVEGQRFAGPYQVLRQPPMGGAPEVGFAVEDVVAGFEQGLPTHLEARFVFGPGEGRRAWINHPAKWGATSLLVQQAGLAPVLWIQDDRGFTLDRRAAPTRTLGREPTRVSLAGDRYIVVVHPPDTPVFPTRDELPTWSLRFDVFSQDITSDEAGQSVPGPMQLLYEGSLRPGEVAALGEARLMLEGLRYWVEILVVSERGGGLLIAGFVAGILGLVWRLLLHRREVALTWDDGNVRLAGSSEYFPERFRDELGSLFATLTDDNGER